MAWKIEFTEKAQKDLADLDKSAQRMIVRYIEERILPSDDPTVFAKPLRHDLVGLWRFRVKDYRVICKIEQNQLIVLILAIGHRKDIYER